MENNESLRDVKKENAERNKLNDKKKGKIGVSDIVLFVVSAFFLIGILTVFAPCGPKEDGSFMTCHWAGLSVAGNAAVLAALSILHMILPDRAVKTGVSLACIPVAVLAAMTPQYIIHMCMMDTMRCHAVMRPAAIVMSILVIAASIFDVVTQKRKS